jgi:hypothetical protein
LDDQSIRNSLAILRKLAGYTPDITAANFLRQLAGEAATERTVFRVAAYLQDQFAQARIVIQNSQLVEEAKAGVLQAINGLETAFSLKHLNSSMTSLLPAVPTYISSLVILLSAAGIDTKQQTPKDASNLADEINQFQKAFDDSSLDPVVRDVAKKHMEALATLLRHVPIFGLEAALTSYFELVMRLRRVDAQSTPEAKKALEPLMGEVKVWGERLGAIDDAINKGATLLERVKSAGHLLQYVPGLVG